MYDFVLVEGFESAFHLHGKYTAIWSRIDKRGHYFITFKPQTEDETVHYILHLT